MNRLLWRTLLACGALVTVVGVSPAFAQSRPAAKTPPGLVSWYEANGNAKDSKGHNNGAIHGGVTFSAGDPGRAFNFNGSTGYVSVGDPADLRSNGHDFTIAARVWFNSNLSPAGSPSKPCYADGGSGCDMSIVTKMTPTSNGVGPNTNGWRLVKQSDDSIWFCLGALDNGCVAGSTTTAISTTLVVPHVWYEVVGVYSQSGGMSLYVNGKLEDHATGANSVNNDTAPFLFGYYPGESFLWGRLNQVQYFNKALSASEISALP